MKTLLVLIKLLSGLLLILSLSVQAEIQVYKVERVVSPRSDTYGDDLHGLGQSLAQFEIAAVEKAKKQVPMPDREDFKQLILIGSEGVATKTNFYEFEKTCEYLCGDELEECHYTGMLSWRDNNIGVPLLVVSGITGEVSNFISHTDTASVALPKLSIPEQQLVWSEENYLGITTEGSESKFSLRYGTDKPYRYSTEGSQCRWFAYQGTGLTRLSCNIAEALLDGEVPLLFSNADYNKPGAQVVNQFTINDQEYFTVMLALKAYTAYGLLTKQNGQWRFIVKPADWSKLC